MAATSGADVWNGSFNLRAIALTCKYVLPRLICRSPLVLWCLRFRMITVYNCGVGGATTPTGPLTSCKA